MRADSISEAQGIIAGGLSPYVSTPPTQAEQMAIGKAGVAFLTAAADMQNQYLAMNAPYVGANAGNLTPGAMGRQLVGAAHTIAGKLAADSALAATFLADPQVAASAGRDVAKMLLKGWGVGGLGAL